MRFGVIQLGQGTFILTFRGRDFAEVSDHMAPVWVAKHSNPVFPSLHV